MGKLFTERKSSGIFPYVNRLTRLFDREYFFRFLRMSPDRYEYLLLIVDPELQRQRTHLREPISPSECLTLTLRYLASGKSNQSLSFALGISRTAISNILADACEKIWKTLSDTYFRAPSSEKDCRRLEYGALYWCD